MADSDDEYDRRKMGRDKFRRERNDYERRDDRRDAGWDHERRYSGGGRPRDQWQNRPRERGGGGGGGGGRPDMYGRDYDNRRRERFSPQRHEMSPPQKRMRTEVPEPDYPTQPAMNTFKQFLSTQDDSISDEEAIKKYNEYKLEFKRQQINEFFMAHKDEEWFKAKYHPEECDKRLEDVKNALKRRLDVFNELVSMGRLKNLILDADKSPDIIKIIDAAVIFMEGGTEFDLQYLDQPDSDDVGRMRNNSETAVALVNTSMEETKPADTSKEDIDSPDEEGEAAEPKKPLEMSITPEIEELQKKAAEFSKQQTEKNGSDDTNTKGKKKRKRDKEYSYESGSESDSGSESESEPVPPGLEGGKDAELETGECENDSANELDNSTEKPKDVKSDDEKEKDTKNEPEELGPPKPKPLHKTCSIFLRNLAPSITKSEVEAMCKRYSGFMRVALQDPAPERRFFCRGWVTFSHDVNIKEICWNLNNIRLRDCELGATLNRELKQRVRPVSGLTNHKQVVKNDIKLTAKIIQNYDAKWKLWDEGGEEKKDKEKDMSFVSFASKNPLLKNITDYLVDEGSYEEEELLGHSMDDPSGNPSDVSIERDEALMLVLDRLVLYLRIVHSIDYYSANEYPNEDEMPHRCGIIHARGSPPGMGKISERDINEWIGIFENKVKHFTETTDKLREEEASKLGKKDPDSEVEKFITANTQELASDRWLCPLSGKKFKGPEFVRKHIFSKHQEKVDEVKKEVAFFNNYLLDLKRPQLPDHPGNRPSGGQNGAGSYSSPNTMSGPPQGQRYDQPRSRGNYGGYNNYNRDRGGGGYHNNYDNRRGGYNRPYNNRYNRRSDPRGLIEYRDLDAPADMDIF